MSINRGGLEISRPPQISTKAELDHLLKNRSVPTPAPQLTPDGPDAFVVREMANVASEGRIANLTERLQRLREDAERDFSLAQVQGRAQCDFESSR
ncbi:MAG: hypothetical protein P1U65_14955 [Minwuia sp.]|nr:hypothetical protein [Minwuia sp.]